MQVYVKVKVYAYWTYFGVSLSEPHTSETALRTCVYMCTCLCAACIWKRRCDCCCFLRGAEPNYLSSRFDFSGCVSMCISSVYGSSTNDGRLSVLPVSHWELFNSSPFGTSLHRLSTQRGCCHLNMLCWLSCQWCRCVLVAWTQWPWM